MGHLPRLAAGAAALLLATCSSDGGGSTPPPTGEPTPGQSVTLEATLRDSTIVSGGGLALIVRGAGVIVPASARVELQGTLAGAPVDARLDASFSESAEGLLVEAPWSALTAALGDPTGKNFGGAVRVVVTDLGGSLEGLATLEGVILEFVDALVPVVQTEPAFEIFLNDALTLGAEGILLEGEGATTLHVVGQFDDELGVAKQVDAQAPVTAVGGRRQARVGWPVSLFGVRPGRFSGTLTPVNTPAAGAPVRGAALDATIDLLKSEIDGFDPPAASRGQVVEVLGRGFLPPDPNSGVAMFFRARGSFETTRGTTVSFTGDEVIELPVEAVESHTAARIVLRSQTRERGGRMELVGLTATPGTFTGTLTPIVVSGSDVVEGTPFEGSLQILPTRQYVYTKYLPSFSEALDRFGLRIVEVELRARVSEVLARDYAQLNIIFGETRPENFVEYSIIEAGGPDPNGAGLFGLDNSEGKDTGNIRLNDIVGSENAAASEEGHYAFGGVFIESFVAFSPRLGGDPNIASERFDALFGPFMPELGGTVIDAAEWPNGERREAIEAAIHALGSIVGNTISHEIGHSLGLSFFQQDLFTASDRFHNDFDEPGSIMDAGSQRPFEERAEIDGHGAPTFNEANLDYLRGILPMQ